MREPTIWVFLSIFGKLAYPRLDVSGIIGREVMKESPMWEEIMGEGRVMQARADILEALLIRFGGDPSQEISQAVNLIEDEVRLRELLRLAIRCGSVEEFRGGLPPPQKRGTRNPKRGDPKRR